jgi:hypothetical protein
MMTNRIFYLKASLSEKVDLNHLVLGTLCCQLMVDGAILIDLVQNMEIIDCICKGFQDIPWIQALGLELQEMLSNLIAASIK